MSFGDGDLHVQVAQLKTENARMKQQLDAMPGIVRCRDCEHYREEYEECMRSLPSGNVVIFDCESHDFCSFGKRKE